DLQAAGPFTVFAPTDAAFGALPAGVLDDLLLPANQADLISVLLYHVVADELTAQEVLGSASLPTLQGADLMVSASLGQVGGADISGTNVLARNGIIHVIDSVLIPPGFIPLTMEGSDPLEMGAIGDASELENEAQWGDVLSPLWSGAFGSQQITFGEFDANGGSPLRPIEGEGAVLRTDGLGVSSKSSGSLTNALAGDLRVSFDWKVLPASVQLDVLFEGGPDAKGSLVLAFEDGSREVLEADSNRIGGGFSVSDWRLDRAGQALIGADLLLNRPSGASGIRGIRIHTSDF
ncbi:MAG: fasciclin domain-containing protein, partial [Planctomycetota bacterium]|nr:fasciclin domain-containing protein [Planctomycetota bacterium]